MVYNSKVRVCCIAVRWLYLSLEDDRSALFELISFYWMGRSDLLVFA